MNAGYRCLGPVRGPCPHTHRTLSGAERCMYADVNACRGQGGNSYSDRRIVRVDAEGWEQELTDDEFAQLDQIRMRPWVR